MPKNLLRIAFAPEGLHRIVATLCLGAALGSFGIVPAAVAAEDPYDGDWHFSLSPYLWLPSIDGELRFNVPPGSSGGSGGGRVDVDVGASDLLAKLNYAFMAAGDVRKGNWSVFTDFITLSIEVDNTNVRSITGPSGSIDIPVDTSSQTKLSGFIWTLAGTYTVINSPGVSLDVLAGFRDAQLKASLDWQFAGPVGLFPQSGSFSDTQVSWDAIVGVKGRIRLSESGTWFIPYYADIGTGSNSFTWQALTGIGYAFGWGDLHLDYRYLHYTTENNRLIKDLTLHGPTLGVSFHF